MMTRAALIPISVVLLMAGEAHAKNSLVQANPTPDTCFPIQAAIGRLKAADLKPVRRDTVDSFWEAHFIEVSKRPLPMKLYLKIGDTQDDFVMRESGEVVDFHTKVFGAPTDSSICGPSQEDGKIGIIMSPSVRFKNNSGTHTLAELLDGAGDGKSHHKKNLGGVQAMFVPKLTHVAIIYDDPDVVPQVSALANGARIPVQPDSYGEMWVIDVDGLEEIKAEILTIGGGSYKLLPVPSIKKMKSLGIK